MPKIKNLSPKMNILSAEMELLADPSVLQMGESVGGMKMYSTSFKRGYGDDVFGLDERGMWMGAADFENAPFRVPMAGAVNIQNGDNSSSFTADGFIFYEAGVPVIVIGDP